METNKYLVYIREGKVSVVVPSPKWEGTLEELAAAVVPEGVEWQVVDAVPHSRNWRDAWALNGRAVEVDLDLAKAEHRKLIARKAKERVAKDVFGNQDFTLVEAEMETCGIDEASTLDELYNAWPKSIDTRQEPRKYSPTNVEQETE